MEQLAREEAAGLAGRYDFEELLRIRSLREMTRQLVLQHTEYPSMEDYLAGYAITGDRLTTLSAPVTVLTSLDDPIIEATDTARVVLASATGKRNQRR